LIICRSQVVTLAGRDGCGAGSSQPAGARLPAGDITARTCPASTAARSPAPDGDGRLGAGSDVLAPPRATVSRSPGLATATALGLSTTPGLA
jgi:hypothetical protein